MATAAPAAAALGVDPTVVEDLREVRFGIVDDDTVDLSNLHRQLLHGEEAAREAIRKSIRELKKERARTIDYQIVPGDPAHRVRVVVVHLAAEVHVRTPLCHRLSERRVTSALIGQPARVAMPDRARDRRVALNDDPRNGLLPRKPARH